MILELDKSQFYKCLHLLNERGQLEAKAVLEGVNPGRVFVDDISSPTTGLIWLGNNDGFFFIGDEQNEGFNNELNNFIDTIITPEAKKVGLTFFEGIGNHSRWNTTIKKVFEHRKIGSWNQRVYILQKEDFKEINIPIVREGYKVVKISETLFKNTDDSITNIDFLRSKLLEFWSTPEKFFSNGIGYCMVYKHEIVSVCFSGFVVGNVHCIDIETLEAHQGKKLAQILARSYVKDCLDLRFVPYWDCMESNKPSISVAENTGFKNVFNYTGFDFPLN
jgi:hypothetical protein